jgi:hypothetical protein
MNHPVNNATLVLRLFPARRTRCLVLIAVLLSMASSSCTPKIPNAVTADEMSLYREWLLQRFAQEPPKELYLDSQTFTFDPLSQGECAKSLHKENDVSRSLMKALHALQNVDYEIDLSPNVWRLPWDYRALDPRHFPKAVPGLHVIAFSRVAFNDSGTQALFSFRDACAFGECGNGGAVVAHKESGKWEFTAAKGCAWMY